MRAADDPSRPAPSRLDACSPRSWAYAYLLVPTMSDRSMVPRPVVFRCAIISSPRRRRRLEPHTWGVTVRGVAREAVEHAERWRRASVVSATLRPVEVGMYTYRLSVEQRMGERGRGQAATRARGK